MTPKSKTLGDEIAEFRKTHRLDRDSFAKGVRLSRTFIQNMEQGKRQASEKNAARIREFIKTADATLIDSLRGPGVGNSTSPVRRGSKLTRSQVFGAEVSRLPIADIDDDLQNLAKS